MSEHGARVFRAQKKRRNPWILGLAVAPLASVPLLILAALLVHPAFAAPTVHLTLLGALATNWAWRRNFRPRLEAVEVKVDGDAMVIGDEVVARRELTRGLVVPRSAGTEAHFAKRGLDVELVLGSEARAKELVAALGFDAEQSVATFRAMSRVHKHFGLVYLSMFGPVIGAGAVGALAGAIHPAVGAGVTAFLTIAGILTLMCAPTKIEVGADGVLVRWLGRKRFIPCSEIDVVHTSVIGAFNRGSRRSFVTLTLSSGKSYEIPVAPAAWDNGTADALAKRIEDAIAVHRRGGAAPQALLARGDRPHTQWISALRRREIVHHRTPAVPKDELWPVIENAGAAPVDRAAAAIALGRDLDASSRERLHRAARAVAAPKLRVVLESVANAEEEALATQLAELEGAKKT